MARHGGLIQISVCGKWSVSVRILSKLLFLIEFGRLHPGTPFPSPTPLPSLHALLPHPSLQKMI